MAVTFALVPHVADLLKKQLDGTLLELLQQGTSSPALLSRLAENRRVYSVRQKADELQASGRIATQEYGMSREAAILEVGDIWFV